ncbi:putative 2-Nitropropane dioxygenase [Ceraceosorus guamensis]|uniref:Putative 2-Nitropropane dioxygenase n=1 Tax=Ceraceosorus guamensis TaxID=1522189 RepID=A0A316W8I7_9BASI|nr:putative 2-Nitropropane dioxygenase [Ceraceosorus guamensis]PWN46189.1 putative 2-Nitropropane dioxygenase [Ceraceosorus guamensis]
MVLVTELTKALGLEVPLVQGGMQWVGVPQLVTAVSNAGGLGLLTALTQPSPDALREAIRETRKNLKPGVDERSKYGGFGVNITILPSINPPDYEGYTRAALEEGVRIFETAGSNPGPIIKAVKEYGGYVIHKCTTVRHARSAQKLGADMLSIDGFECAGHPGEDDIGGLVLMARAFEELSVPFIASGGIANGQGLAAALALGACGANMGTRFMCTKEADIHENVKRAIVDSDERQTVHMFRTLRNTARVFKNKVSMQVVELEKKGAKFPEIQPLVSGQRGRKVYTEGDLDAGVWTAGITLGLIHDIPTCEELVKRIGQDAEKHIDRLASLSAHKSSSSASRESRL